MELRKKAAPFRLEQRHIDVVKLLAKGNTAKQIAEKGGVSNKLVESIIGVLFKEYKCKNAPHLVYTFMKKQLIK